MSHGDIGLGRLIEKGQDVGRDAVHVAVAPVYAGEDLEPGQHVGIFEGEKVRRGRGGHESNIGIVDPFLTHSVPKGSRFYLYLYPGSITSLRHSWDHPAFAILKDGGKIDVRYVVARERLEMCATANGDLKYDDLVQAAISYIDYGEYLSEGPRFDGAELYSEFWDDFEVVTGRFVPHTERGSFFSCSC